MLRKMGKLVPITLVAALLVFAVTSALAAGDRQTGSSSSEAPPEQVEVTCVEDYVVQAGDWLSRIAEQFFGDPMAYPAIVEATNAAAAAGGAYATLLDPGVIEPGQVLCIPTAEVAEGLLAGGQATMAETAESTETEEETATETETATATETEAETTAETETATETTTGTTAETETAAETEAPAAAETEAETTAEADTATGAEAGEETAAETTTTEESAITSSTAEIISEDERLSTLAEVLEATNLDELLASEEGPFTVFGPTDDAFTRLPEGSLDRLRANPDQLTQVLLYHISEDTLATDGSASVGSIETLLGEPLEVTTAGGTIQVGGAQIEEDNALQAANGKIYLVDTVLLPRGIVAELSSQAETAAETETETTTGTAADTETATETATETGAAEEPAGVETGQATAPAVAPFTFFEALAAVARGGSIQLGVVPVTIFAPTADAFAFASQGSLSNLMANPQALQNVVLYHVVYGDVRKADLDESPTLYSVSGQPLQVSAEDGTLSVEDAQLVATDFQFGNIVIHVINKVLLPDNYR